MKDNNIQLVLQRLQEVFEQNLYNRNAEVKSLTRKSNKMFTQTEVLNLYVKSSKQVIRELLMTGCPYEKIWDCKAPKG